MERLIEIASTNPVLILLSIVGFVPVCGVLMWRRHYWKNPHKKR